jgi:hypothetical protein
MRREPLLHAAPRFCATSSASRPRRASPASTTRPVTLAFLFLIREGMPREAERFEEFAARNPELLTWKPSALDRYYRRRTLASERARQGFVLPDRLAPRG